MFRILHLSDLHFHDHPEQATVLNALLIDVARAQANKKIDAVVFSGDAAAKGRTSSDVVASILSEFVEPIRVAVGADVPFIVCPGNHDIDLKRRSNIYDPVFKNIDSPAKANDFVKDAGEPHLAALWDHVAGFRSFAAAIDGAAFVKSPVFYTKLVEASGIKVGFACLNSAWMTSGGGAADYGRLYVGESALETARKEIQEAQIKIAVLHHPLSWLAPEEKVAIQRQLTLNFDAYLCGHMHDTNAEAITSNVGNLFTSNTGCIYQNREYFNGFSILDLDVDLRRWTVSAREFYFQRGLFDVATRFAQNGTYEFSFDCNALASKVLIPGEVLKAINERANALLLSHSSSEVAPKALGALFVEPPLSFISEKELLAKSNDDRSLKDQMTSLTALARKTEAIFFLGKKEIGKSLLIHQVAVNQFQAFHSTARVGVVIDIQAVSRLTEASLLEQAVEFCGGEIPRRDLIKLLQSGEAVICFDNVKIHDPKIVALVTQFCSRFPGNRYVLAGSEEVLDGVTGNVLPDFGFPILRVFVHSFREKHTKELVKRWFGSEDLVLNRRVSTINGLLARLRVPRTPFLVSVLSWVLEQRPNAVVMNRASAVEVLVEGLLEKLKEPKLRREFDSTIQQHFLSEFSVLLDRSSVEWITRLDFDEFVINYFRRRGLNTSTEGFANDLVRKGLLFAGDGRVGFKFDCFRAFFLARKFAEVPDLWQNALTASTISRYAEELDLFTGLYRDRSDVLKRSRDLCKETFEKLDIEFPLQEIDRLGTTDARSPSSILALVEASLESDGETDDEIEVPDLVSADHEEARKRRHVPDLGEVGRFVESLRAFSMILRNSELVDDVELKRECFQLALEHWANTAIAVILAVTEQTKRIKLRHKDGTSTALADEEEMVSTVATALIPQMVVTLMAETLATPKLELFAREGVEDTRTLVRTLAIFLSLDAEDSLSIVMARNLLKQFRNNSFIVQMLFFKLLSVYIARGGNGDSADLRELLADTFVAMNGATLVNTMALKSRFLSQIDKNVQLGWVGR